MKKKTTKRTKNSYSTDFKTSAIELAKQIGTQQAADKLGIKSIQTLSAWIRYSKKLDSDDEFRDIEKLKAENKKLKKELESEKKITAILKDATAFFCQDRLK
jgi:transposase-like protein